MSGTALRSLDIRATEAWRDVAVQIPLRGGVLRARLDVPRGDIRLSQLAPVARQLSRLIVQQAQGLARGCGASIPCRKGCAACCRYLVPLSPPEAFRLWDDLQTLPPDRQRTILRRFDAAARRLLDAAPCPQAEALPALSRWYRSLDVTCPLLEDECCALYSRRPLACREFLVNGAPTECSSDSTDSAQLPLPVSPALALARLAAELEGEDDHAILLPLAPAWAMNHPERRRQTWPAGELVDRLLTVMQG